MADLCWPDEVLDALVDRVIGQSWRASTQHPPRISIGVVPDRTVPLVDPWLPEERLSRRNWNSAIRPANANFFGKAPPKSGTTTQALVAQQLSTKGLAATIYEQAHATRDPSKLMSIGVPVDLASLLTDPSGSPALERVLSAAQAKEPLPQQLQLRVPKTTLSFCHDDGSDPSSGWRAHLPDLRHVDGPNDGSAADLLPRFSNVIAVAEDRTLPGLRGVRTIGRPDQWARDNGRLATDGQTSYLLRPRWSSRGDDGTAWWPAAELAAESYVRAGHAVSRDTGLLWQGGNVMLFREHDGTSHLLISTTTLARNQRLGLKQDEAAQALKNTFGADQVTVLTPSGFHLDIEISVVQTPDGPVFFVADPIAAARLLLENAFGAPADNAEQITQYRSVIDRNPPNPTSARLQHACDLLLAESLLANESKGMAPEVRSAFAALVRMAERRTAIVQTLQDGGYDVRRVPSFVSIGRLWGPANALVTTSHVYWPQFGAGTSPAELEAASVYEGLGRHVTGQPARAILERDGGLHCALEPIPARAAVND